MDMLSYNSSLSYDHRSSVDVLCSRKDCYGSLDIKCGSPPPLLHADEVKGQTKKRSRHHSASHRNLKKRRFIGVPDDNKDSNHHHSIIIPPPPPIAVRQLSTVAPLLTALTDDEPVQGLSPAQNAMQAEIIEPPSSSSSSASSPLTSFSLSGSNFLNDRYAFVNDIIQSQFGRVFIATDRFKMKSFNLNSNQVFDPDNVYVAIKQSSKERMSSFGLRTADDVRREASVLRILNGSSSFASHPYRQFIYQYIDEFETDAYHHIVTSYASKGDLLSLAVPANGNGAMNTFPETFARNVFSQVIAGVALLHNIGVGHCDLSLENFCLRSDGSISIIDLGAAQIHPNSILWREAESDSSLHPDVKYLQTIPNHTMPVRSSQPFESFLVTPVPNAAIPGKKNYICSECFEGADYDIFAADCWAIGVSLFAAVTGKFPYARPMEDDVHFRALMSGAWAAEERKRSDDATSGAAADQSRPTLSYELIQLLDAIFKPSALRPTVRQLLEFGWFHEQS